MSCLETLVEAVKSVKKDEDVLGIVRTFNLLAEDRSGKLDQIFGVYTGTVDGKAVQVTHRWYDRCRPFSIQPDGNKVELLIDGQFAARPENERRDMQQPTTLTAPRLSWLHALAKAGGWVSWERMPRRNQAAGFGQKVAGITNRTWLPMVEAGWIEKRFTGQMEFRITEAGKAIVASQD